MKKWAMFSLKVDDQIQLMLVHPSFAPRYVELVKDSYDDLAQWLVWPPFCKTVADFEGFVKRSLHDYADGKSMTCGMFYQNELVGNVSFNNINRQLKKVEIGYWLATGFQGKGIVTRVCQKLVDLAFNQLHFDKVEIQAASENTASRAVAERLGMSLEGVISNAEVVDGVMLSYAIYGLHRTKA